jgi:choline/glycine/proline betaine transport protein
VTPLGCVDPSPGRDRTEAERVPGRCPLAGEYRLVETAVEEVPVAIFAFLEAFPLRTGLSVVGLLVTVIYFVTSSDSASVVIDLLASGGDEDPPVGTRVLWAISEGLVGATLLVAGGLQAMSTFQITTASTDTRRS